MEQKCLIVRSEEGYRLSSKAFEHFVKQKLGDSWSQAIQDGKRQLVTVLYVDVAEYTPMTASHQPEEILDIIKQAQRIFVDVVSQHNGYVANFGGDSVMALFGVPEVRPDDAIRAGTAALEIQERIAVYSQTLRENKRIDFAVRIGLDTGPVVLGIIGNEQRSEYTALGDAVNLASRLQSHPSTEPGTVVMSNHTYQQVRGHFTVKTLGDWEIKGKACPIKVYQILGIKKR